MWSETMIKRKKVPLFAVYILLLLTKQRASANFPSIQPVPCSNDVTGERGLCTFNWYCVNVAHGIHIGPCVDRFFVGSCCKILQTTKPDDAKVQTAQKDSQTTPYTILFQTVASKAETPEKVKLSENRDEVTSIHQHKKPLFETRASEIVFDFEPSPNHELNLKNSSLVQREKPVISAEFLHKLFFPSNISIDKNFHDVYRHNSSMHSQKPITESPFSQTSTTTAVSRFKTKPGLEFHYGEIPVANETFHNFRKPVATHSTHDLRQPVQMDEHHNLRKPVPLSEEHDLRWPVLEEDSHDQRLPVVNLYEWSGKWYLNNHQKPNGSNDFYSLTTETFNISSVASVSTDFPTESSQAFEQTTDDFPISTPSTTSTNLASINYSFLDTFTSPRPYTKVPSSHEPGSIQESISYNVSQVCGRSRGGTTARIVGGRKSHNLRWPWMISLRRFEDKSYKHKCGAALLNGYWAITAAHCVDGKGPLDIIVRLGEYNFRRVDEVHPHVERQIFVIVLHPEFDHITYENDLALLRFNQRIQLRPNMVPVCLPNSMDDITGRIAVVTGWGRLSQAGELPASLHEVRMPILSNEECERMYYEAGFTENIRDVFVCAGLSNGGLDACEGDSGGPMVVQSNEGQWTLVGLISWGMGCAAPNQPGVYTRISRFTDWIEGIISH